MRTAKRCQPNGLLEYQSSFTDYELAASKFPPTLALLTCARQARRCAGHVCSEALCLCRNHKATHLLEDVYPVISGHVATALRCGCALEKHNAANRPVVPCPHDAPCATLATYPLDAGLDVGLDAPLERTGAAGQTRRAPSQPCAAVRLESQFHLVPVLNSGAA